MGLDATAVCGGGVVGETGLGGAGCGGFGGAWLGPDGFDFDAGLDD